MSQQVWDQCHASDRKISCTKLTDKLSKGSKLGESCEDQKDRYVDSLPSDWKVFMVSLDGSIGLTFTELIEEVKKIIKR